MHEATSTLLDSSTSRWFLDEWETLARIVGIVLAALVLSSVARRASTALERRLAERKEDAARALTISRVFMYLLGTLIWTLAIVLVLAELGVSVAPLLATAGVAGVALGFGAQAIVRDHLSGLFLLLEDQLREGEVVRIAGHAGVVEAITLRHVRLRDLTGRVVFLPCGEIKVVENLTRTYAFVVLDVPVSYAADLDHVTRVLSEVFAEARQDEALAGVLPEPGEILGVHEFAASAVLVRARIKVVPAAEQWRVRRALLGRVKRAFDRAGLEVPYQQIVVHTAPRAPRAD